LASSSDRSRTVPSIPLATYRLQFNRACTFRDAERLVPYLDDLGISHIYASPYLKARAGSTHGYDITDHSALNPEIGDRTSFEAMTAALRRHGMGQILDFVPNHMGIGKADNDWWLDVLEWGQASPYAGFFDIDWAPAKAGLRGKVLLPVLGDHYGQVLEGGELTLSYDNDAGEFSVWYHEHRFPINPRQYARILAYRLGVLRRQGPADASLVAALDHFVAEFGKVRAAGASARRRAALRERASQLKRELAGFVGSDPRARAYLDGAVDHFNGIPGRPESFIPLHRLLEAQAYRLAFWRVAADEINYRRFFDINDLAGLKIELPELFEIAHRLVFRLIEEGKVQGLRIDHIDGLFDPRQYCERVQARARELLAERAAGTGEDRRAGGKPDAPLYLVVEKILAAHEHLATHWPIAGSSGYEFANLVNGLFVDGSGERPLDRLYRRFTGQAEPFDEVLYRAKKHVMETSLASELQVLANELDRISESQWRTRDYTLGGLRQALIEVVACFPVYRTYVDRRGASADDRRDIDWAISQAKRRSTSADPSVFDFVRAILTTDLVRTRRSGYSRREVVRFAMKFQQYTGPVMAKGLEDTSLYRYHRLVSLNEVGGDPRRFGVSVAAFHHQNLERARHWPHAMLATATHDTKRGEDLRARLNLLSEIPEEWGRRVRRWSALNRRRRTIVDDGPAPTPNEEYFLYQTLVGAWPAELTGRERPDPERLERFRDRIADYMVKVLREAKRTSSWLNPNEAHEAAVVAFVRKLLDARQPNPFLADFVAFQERIAVLGVVNSLSQLLIKTTAPGVPDFYQGSELWDLNLVDPDNRRPVDFNRRRESLNRLQDDLSAAPTDFAEKAAELLRSWQDGRIKQYLLWQLLQLRRDNADLFLNGSYVPLVTAGDRHEHVCAFARERDGRSVLVAAPRLVAKLYEGAPAAASTDSIWADTVMVCPPADRLPRYRSVLINDIVEAESRDGVHLLSMGGLFENFPVAVLVSLTPA
jgi:(1->4)-alpha-D-glucan 1-alpha-D-glucosylmutase